MPFVRNNFEAIVWLQMAKSNGLLIVKTTQSKMQQWNHASKNIISHCWIKTSSFGFIVRNTDRILANNIWLKITLWPRQSGTIQYLTECKAVPHPRKHRHFKS